MGKWTTKSLGEKGGKSGERERDWERVQIQRKMNVGMGRRKGRDKGRSTNAVNDGEQEPSWLQSKWVSLCPESIDN